jgi:hypothetical protein
MFHLSRIFYEDQAGWEMGDYAQLMRNMSRLFNYMDRKQEEINSLDLSRMNVVTKTFMAALTSIPQRRHLWETDQFRELADMKPFKERLDLTIMPSTGNQQMVDYNIGW